jgi:uncharacterized protein YndB with AHSA1/START domain
MKLDSEAPDDLVFDFDLPAPPEKVWRALTIPALLDRWLLPAEESDAGRFAGTPEPLGRHIEAEVLEAEPPRRLRWSWRERGERADVVTFTLLPNGDGGTALRLVHERRIVAMLLPKPANGNTAMRLAA